MMRYAEYFGLDPMDIKAIQNKQNVTDGEVEALVNFIFPSLQENEALIMTTNPMHTSAVQKSIEDINNLSTGDTVVDGSLVNAKVQGAITELGVKITRVNAATKSLISQSIRRSVDEGLDVVQTAQNLRELGLDEYYKNRALTIAKNETRLGYSDGTKISFEDLEVKTFDVVGCTGTLSGTNALGMSASYGDFSENIGNCGILDIPMNFYDFISSTHHVNHQGVEVPSEIT